MQLLSSIKMASFSSTGAAASSKHTSQQSLDNNQATTINEELFNTSRDDDSSTEKQILNETDPACSPVATTAVDAIRSYSSNDLLDSQHHTISKYIALPSRTNSINHEAATKTKIKTKHHLHHQPVVIQHPVSIVSNYSNSNNNVIIQSKRHSSQSSKMQSMMLTPPSSNFSSSPSSTPLSLPLTSPPIVMNMYAGPIVDYSNNDFIITRL
jgi:hypothetical protein